MKVDFYYSQIQESPFVSQFAKGLGMQKNTVHAERILTAFFRTLRERIPPFASNALFTYLPKDIKPLYTIGWNNRFSTQFDYDEFIDALYAVRGTAHIRLFCSKTKVEEAVSVFFEVLKKRLNRHTYETLMSLMPLVLKINLLKDYVFEGHSYIV